MTRRKVENIRPDRVPNCQLPVTVGLETWRRGRKWKEDSHPRSSKKRQITFATISSFFSKVINWPGLFLVRAANFSDTVAPRQSVKSIVEDYTHVHKQDCVGGGGVWLLRAIWDTGESVSKEGQGKGPKPEEVPHILTFCLLNSSSMMPYATCQPDTRSARAMVCDEL